MIHEELKTLDADVWQAIQGERQRQRDGLEMIASENYTSAAVLECQGSVLTNKYAEGYPGRRYYGGCEKVDIVENLAIDRAKALFGADHANVQPHSGASANLAVYFATLKPGDTLLTMDLAHGGHLTHGSPVNSSGKLYNIVHYGVDEKTEQIDYNRVAELAQEHRPKMIVAGASAYPRTLDFEAFGKIARDVEALLLVDMAHIAGLVAGGQHPNPTPHADFVSSTSHKTMRGPRGGFVLCKSEWAKKLNSAVFPGLQGGPLMHVVAGKAVMFQQASQPAFAEYARNVVENAQALCQTLQAGGLRIVSGGTDNHLMLVDVTVKEGMTGKIAEKALDAAGLTANKNMIPFDKRKPMDPSGIRLGTPALTTRGMGPVEMKQVGEWILQTLDIASDESALAALRQEVAAFASQFPVPGIEAATEAAR